jgi:HSP20 family molecular chaperone IbpA
MKGFADWCFLSLATFCMLGLVGCSKHETMVEQTTPTPVAAPAVIAAIAPTLTAAPSLASAVSDITEPRDSVESEGTLSETPNATSSSVAEINQDFEELQARVDSVFLGGWQSLGRQFGASTFIASTDLREQPDRFVVRVYGLNLDTSKVQAKIEGDALHVSAPGTRSDYGIDATSGREEIITLQPSIEANRIKVDRKGNLVVITVPKTTSTAVKVASARTPTPTDNPADWNGRLVDVMSQMQERMDGIFRDAFPNDLLKGSNVLRHGSAVDVDDQKDRYVVHFCIPGRDLETVNVKFKEGQLNLITQPQCSHSKGGDAEKAEAGKYEQVITLSQPVKESWMKVERSGSTVTVTLPKAL